MILDEQHAGRSIEVGKGEGLVVRLKENPTTGYRWAIDDADNLEQESDHSENDNAPGAGGVREFRFRVPQAGSAELRLKKWREWEGDKSVIERFNLHLRVT